MWVRRDWLRGGCGLTREESNEPLAIARANPRVHGDGEESLCDTFSRWKRVLPHSAAQLRYAVYSRWVHETEPESMLAASADERVTGLARLTHHWQTDAGSRS